MAVRKSIAKTIRKTIRMVGPVTITRAVGGAVVHAGGATGQQAFLLVWFAVSRKLILWAVRKVLHKAGDQSL